MRNTVENNLELWDRQHGWPKDGDEWDGQARYCGQPYEAWKRSLVDTFVVPHVSHASTVLEIAPGHGRWSREIAPLCGRLILVDLSPSCIDYCRRRLAEYDHVEYLVNDGRNLAAVADASVDFVWSYDAFVHMDPETIRGYFAEIRRVLGPAGRATIHHAGRRHAFLRLGFLRHTGKLGTALYRTISMSRLGDVDGWRSDVSARLVRRMAAECGLSVEAQLQSWGARGEFGVRRFNDYVSVLVRAESGA